MIGGVVRNAIPSVGFASSAKPWSRVEAWSRMITFLSASLLVALLVFPVREVLGHRQCIAEVNGKSEVFRPSKLGMPCPCSYCVNLSVPAEELRSDGSRLDTHSHCVIPGPEDYCASRMTGSQLKRFDMRGRKAHESNLFDAGEIRNRFCGNKNMYENMHIDVCNPEKIFAVSTTVRAEENKCGPQQIGGNPKVASHKTTVAKNCQIGIEGLNSEKGSCVAQTAIASQAPSVVPFGFFLSTLINKPGLSYTFLNVFLEASAEAQRPGVDQGIKNIVMNADAKLVLLRSPQYCCAAQGPGLPCFDPKLIKNCFTEAFKAHVENALRQFIDAFRLSHFVDYTTIKYWVHMARHGVQIEITPKANPTGKGPVFVKLDPEAYQEAQTHGYEWQWGSEGAEDLFSGPHTVAQQLQQGMMYYVGGGNLFDLMATTRIPTTNHGVIIPGRRVSGTSEAKCDEYTFVAEHPKYYKNLCNYWRLLRDGAPNPSTENKPYRIALLAGQSAGSMIMSENVNFLHFRLSGDPPPHIIQNPEDNQGKRAPAYWEHQKGDGNNENFCPGVPQLPEKCDYFHSDNSAQFVTGAQGLRTCRMQQQVALASPRWTPRQLLQKTGEPEASGITPNLAPCEPACLEKCASASFSCDDLTSLLVGGSTNLGFGCSHHDVSVLSNNPREWDLAEAYTTLGWIGGDLSLRPHACRKEISISTAGVHSSKMELKATYKPDEYPMKAWLASKMVSPAVPMFVYADGSVLIGKWNNDGHRQLRLSIGNADFDLLTDGDSDESDTPRVAKHGTTTPVIPFTSRPPKVEKMELRSVSSEEAEQDAPGPRPGSMPFTPKARGKQASFLEAVDVDPIAEPPEASTSVSKPELESNSQPKAELESNSFLELLTPTDGSHDKPIERHSVHLHQEDESAETDEVDELDALGMGV
ncbi:unnamed protein product [Amoebophrya sp. A25]|nr:unnamed protein product [Amoebophrya sp. A25]|eukprot:GSA25T00003622001.1